MMVLIWLKKSNNLSYDDLFSTDFPVDMSMIPAIISNSSMWTALRNGHRYSFLKKNIGDRKAYRMYLRRILDQLD